MKLPVPAKAGTQGVLRQLAPRLRGGRAILFAWLFTLTSCFATATFAAEGDFQAIPPLKHRVTDLTSTLSAADAGALESRLKEFEANKGAQIAVLMVPTTQPETIFDYTLRVAETWKLGRKGVDDAVLLVVAKNDRKIQILTGRGIQGTMTDAMSKRIISEYIAPRFRAGDYPGGLSQGVEKMISVLDGEELPAPKRRSSSVSSGGSHGDFSQSFVIVVIAALIVIPLFRMIMGRFVGAVSSAGLTGGAAWFLTGGAMFLPILVAVIVFMLALFSGLLGRGGGFGGGFGGFSGGGGGGGSSDSFSGGGGDFDGGGASGDY